MRWRKPVTFVLTVLMFAGPGRSRAAETPDEPDLRNDPFLAEVQQRTFQWFWDVYRADNGLFPDRAPSESFCSVAAVGFGLTAFAIGAERGYVPRTEARDRVLTTLRFLSGLPTGDQPSGTAGYRGFFYHFLEMETGHRFRQNELSSIDTSLLMWGVLFCHDYFDGDDPAEVELRRLADALYRRVEWDWMQPRAPLIAMAWTPEHGFGGADYRGFNEAMFLYIMALGSPTHPVATDAWGAFTDSYQWGTFHGQQYYQFSPMFGYQYSHVWIDPRELADQKLRAHRLDCLAHARRAMLANRSYCIANPKGLRDYSDAIWGLTACDGPARYDRATDRGQLSFNTYWARGASLREINDDGTIAPTAVGGSVPFAPKLCLTALRTMAERYGDRLYTRHGFVDAFNPTFRFPDVKVERGTVDPELGWFDVDHLGIDQGPIVAMIENYRSGLVWRVMRTNPVLRKGLQRAGFDAPWLNDAAR